MSSPPDCDRASCSYARLIAKFGVLANDLAALKRPYQSLQSEHDEHQSRSTTCHSRYVALLKMHEQLVSEHKHLLFERNIPDTESQLSRDTVEAPLRLQEAWQEMKQRQQQHVNNGSGVMHVRGLAERRETALQLQNNIQVHRIQTLEAKLENCKCSLLLPTITVSSTEGVERRWSTAMLNNDDDGLTLHPSSSEGPVLADDDDNGESSMNLAERDNNEIEESENVEPQWDNRSNADTTPLAPFTSHDDLYKPPSPPRRASTSFSTVDARPESVATSGVDVGPFSSHVLSSSRIAFPPHQGEVEQIAPESPHAVPTSSLSSNAPPRPILSAATTPTDDPDTTNFTDRYAPAPLEPN